MLSTTTKGYPVGFGGLAAGLTLAMIHLATIPVDNTSVNPARSFGTAIFSSWDAMAQLWAFIIFPLIGAVLGVLVWLLVHEERLEDTMFGGQQGLVSARNRAAAAAGRVEGSIDDRLPLTSDDRPGSSAPGGLRPAWPPPGRSSTRVRRPTTRVSRTSAHLDRRRHGPRDSHSCMSASTFVDTNVFVVLVR